MRWATQYQMTSVAALWNMGKYPKEAELEAAHFFQSLPTEDRELLLRWFRRKKRPVVLD